MEHNKECFNDSKFIKQYIKNHTGILKRLGKKYAMELAYRKLGQLKILGTVIYLAVAALTSG